MKNLPGAKWRKSSRSNSHDHEYCVEVADNLPGVVGVRDSKDQTGSTLSFAPGAWQAFVDGVSKP